MRQQIGEGRIDRFRVNPQAFMYYRHPFLNNSLTGPHRFVRVNSGRIVHNNPQRNYHLCQLQKASVSYLQGKYRLRSPLDQRSQRISRLPKLSIKTSINDYDEQASQGDLSEQQLLAERARQFVTRLQKQKQYHYGKAVIRKRKQEQHRKNKQKQDSKMKHRYQKDLKQSKFNRIMDSILFHEERISQRLRNSISRYRLSALRSKTQEIPSNQSAQFQDMDSSQSIIRYSPIRSLKSKTKT